MGQRQVRGSGAPGGAVTLNNEGFISSLLIRDRTFQRRRAAIFSDFIGGYGEWSSRFSGAGATNSLTAVVAGAGLPTMFAGFVTHITGTTATGRAALVSGFSAFCFRPITSVYKFTAPFRAIFRIPIVSTGTEGFIYRFGFIDNDSAESVDGCFVRINADNTAQFVSRANNIETAIPIAAFLPGQIYNVEIVVEGAAIATLKLFASPLNTGEDGVTPTTYTINTNIPSGSNRVVGAGSYLQKTVGLTPRTVDIDFMYAGMDL